MSVSKKDVVLDEEISLNPIPIIPSDPKFVELKSLIIVEAASSV